MVGSQGIRGIKMMVVKVKVWNYQGLGQEFSGRSIVDRCPAQEVFIILRATTNHVMAIAMRMKIILLMLIIWMW